ncbi:MAG: cob(I)yrinic acid a,c-diamide adenosyltransferase [Flavobacteriales bacterium]|jgi:cob(I)alamin adenosyltransferase|nr:cob(I)yrinic acid a,c-diamide adenosyltransferase [Flavobacteriales bacterium]
MKIYTKKGDSGSTQLLGGTIVKKNHIRLECYGTIDELNAFVGNIYDDIEKKSHKKFLYKIQNQLFNLGSCIAYDGKKSTLNLPNISENDVSLIESEIDKIDNKLPVLKNFILPSGHTIASKCHIARTVCRRAERNLIAIEQDESINHLHLIYLNRLSDYLFVLARSILMENDIPAVEWQKD